ncbi:MAG: protein-export chaperone SecB [Nonlabens sp.]
MKTSTLTFQNFVVSHFHYETLKENISENKFTLRPRALLSRKEEKINIHIDLTLKDIDNMFFIKLSATGLFDFDFQDETYLNSFISINGPAIIFPYIRSFISSFTALSGLDTVTLPTLNLSGYKQDILDNMIDLDREEEEE